MSNSEPLYIVIFISGLFGGFSHCIGMCGPLIATYTISRGISPLRAIRPHLTYHSGRLMIYSLIGGFMGFSGSFITTLRPLGYIQSIAMAIAGVLIILTGISIIRSETFFISHLPILRTFINLSKRISEAGGAGNLFPLGMINGIIPCGLSYTAFISASGIGAEEANPLVGFLKGFFLLLLFGSGTLPSLLLLSHIVSKVSGILRRRLYTISAIFMIIAGLIFIYRALRYVN